MLKKTLFFIHPYNSGFIDQDLEALNDQYRIISLKGIDYPGTLAGYLKLAADIRNNVKSSDICFAWFADIRALLTILFSRIHGKKVIVQIGGYEVCSLPELNYGGMRSIFSGFKIRRVLKNADMLLTLSDFNRKEVDKFVEKKKVRTVYLGITGRKVPDSDTERNLVTTVANATVDKYRLKGLETFARVSAQIPEYQFVIAGKTDDKTRKHLLSFNDRLVFTGYLSQNELYRLLDRTMVYCQLSRRESFGMALLEAMSRGCVPVVTDRGALPEVAGDLAFYTDYGQVERTVEMVRSALESDLSGKMAERAFRAFPFQNRKEKLIEILEEFS